MQSLPADHCPEHHAATACLPSSAIWSPDKQLTCPQPFPWYKRKCEPSDNPLPLVHWFSTSTRSSSYAHTFWKLPGLSIHTLTGLQPSSHIHKQLCTKLASLHSSCASVVAHWHCYWLSITGTLLVITSHCILEFTTSLAILEMLWPS